MEHNPLSQIKHRYDEANLLLLPKHRYDGATLLISQLKQLRVDFDRHRFLMNSPFKVELKEQINLLEMYRGGCNV